MNTQPSTPTKSTKFPIAGIFFLAAGAVMLLFHFFRVIINLVLHYAFFSALFDGSFLNGAYIFISTIALIALGLMLILKIHGKMLMIPPIALCLANFFGMITYFIGMIRMIGEYKHYSYFGDGTYAIGYMIGDPIIALAFGVLILANAALAVLILMKAGSTASKILKWGVSIAVALSALMTVFGRLIIHIFCLINSIDSASILPDSYFIEAILFGVVLTAAYFFTTPLLAKSKETAAPEVADEVSDAETAPKSAE